jgi:rhamnogalacturonan endolyase
MDNKDNTVHGWIAGDSGGGFWVITPSNEFKNGGPLKRELTSHIGPACICQSCTLVTVLVRGDHA